MADAATSSTLEEIKISELPVADQANASDMLEASQLADPGFVSRSITLDQVATYIAMSEQIATVIDDAIAEIPPPPPNDWDSITGKPATFPPATHSHPESDITGLTTALDGKVAVAGDTMTGPLVGTEVSLSGKVFADGLDTTADQSQYALIAGRWSAGFNFAALNTKGTYGWAIQVNSVTALTLESTGAALTVPLGVGGPAGPAMLRSTVADSALAALFSGTTKGVRIVHDATRASIEGVDTTGTGSFQPIRIKGTTITLEGPVTCLNEIVFPTQPPLTNNTTGATTAFVAAALAAGASISVGTSPPGSPSANQLWWNTDASVGGGQLYIYYDSFWVPASPSAGAGGVLQTVLFSTGTVDTGTALIPYDNTKPQITEGKEFMTCAITPKSASSRLIVTPTCILGVSIVTPVTCALFRDSGVDALGAVGWVIANTAACEAFQFPVIVASGSTAPTTFRVRAGGRDASTTTFNGAGGVQLYGGASPSSIVIQEVL